MSNIASVGCRVNGATLLIAVMMSRHEFATFSVSAGGAVTASGTGQFFPGDETAFAGAVAVDMPRQVVAPALGVATTGRPSTVVAQNASVVLAGQARLNGVNVYGLSRQRFDGSQDPSFSGDGRQRTRLDGLEGAATAVAVDRSRRVIAAGAVQVSAALPQEARLVRPVRYTSGGAVEQELGDHAVPDGSQPATSMTTTASGREVFVGGAVELADAGGPHLSVMKFGSGSRGFGSGPGGVSGTAVAPVQSGPARDVTLDGRGRILAVGQVADAIGVFRFGRQGRPDRSFGGSGRVMVRFDVGGAVPEAVIVDDRERIIVVGEAGDDIALFRLTDGGALDPSFGIGGKVFGQSLGDERRRGKQVVLQSDGDLSVVGDSFVPLE